MYGQAQGNTAPPQCRQPAPVAMPRAAKQANDEDMVAHDAADAEASLTRPELAGQIKKGGFILMDKKHPCEVLEIKHSKTGKHGKAKCRGCRPCRSPLACCLLLATAV